MVLGRSRVVPKEIEGGWVPPTTFPFCQWSDGLKGVGGWWRGIHKLMVNVGDSGSFISWVPLGCCPNFLFHGTGGRGRQFSMAL